MKTFEDEIVESLPGLRRRALRLCRNAADAEDLVNDAIVQALLLRAKYQPGTNMGAWLFAIARNANLSDYRRMRLRQKANESAAMQELVASQIGEQDAAMLWREVEAVFQKLNTEWVATFTSVVVDGMTYENAARRHRVPVGTVRSRVFRVRNALRRLLEQEAAPAVEPRPRVGRTV